MKTALTTLAFALLATSMIAGCSADTTDGEEDAEGSEDALSQGRQDEKNMKAIRTKVADVNETHVTFAATTKSPSSSPSSGWRNDTSSLYGVDWFQKWSGGVNADHGWDNGTEFGKRCMWAATLRFEAIMKEAPAELKAFRAEYTKWSGGFYNWVDDYSKPESYGDASGARLWSWRTGLSKWISAAAKDGSCFLPTKQMVIDYTKACKEHIASSEDKEMQGCEAR